MKRKVFTLILIIGVTIFVIYLNKNIYMLWNDGSLTVSSSKGVINTRVKVEFGYLKDVKQCKNDLFLMQLTENKILYDNAHLRNVPFLNSNGFFLITLDDKYYYVNFIDKNTIHEESKESFFQRNQYSIALFYKDSVPIVQIISKGRGSGTFTGPMSQTRFADLQLNNIPKNGAALKKIKEELSQ